jgi:ribosomal protein S18 acetylase RimI-like enzyme
MPKNLSFCLPPQSYDSDYRWMNIDRNGVRVGKVRGKIEDKVLTIHSIVIFPEYEGRGFGKKTVDMFKSKFDLIIADRVRPKAVGFWERMDFNNNGDGSYVFQN